jgi:hypothetical protein
MEPATLEIVVPLPRSNEGEDGTHPRRFGHCDHVAPPAKNVSSVDSIMATEV